MSDSIVYIYKNKGYKINDYESSRDHEFYYKLKKKTDNIIKIIIYLIQLNTII